MTARGIVGAGLLVLAISTCQSPSTESYYNLAQVRGLGGKSGFRSYDGNPILTVGEAGAWDAGALGSMTVLKVGDVFHLYYEAWGKRSGKEWDQEEYSTLQIGHATSRDGIHWQKDPNNPVLPRGSKDDWDSDGTWDSYVIYEDGLFKMWYGGGNEECDWGYAISKDGIHFEKKGRLSHLGALEDDHVVHDPGNARYYMYYWDRKHEPVALFRVQSVNETDFDFERPEPIRVDGEYYPHMYKFTHVVKEGDTWHMFYADFVRPHCAEATTRYATSHDGLHWTLRNKNVVEGHDAEILKIEDDLYLMYYGRRGYFDRKDCDIRVAVYNGQLSDLALDAGGLR